MAVARVRRWRSVAAITTLYAIVVIAGSAFHEPWRDEVVPLSIARSASSLTDLIAPLKFEGHPILWYVVLHEAYALVGQTWVLKGASLASAIGAIWLFMRCCPFPWWLCCLFVFSFFPLYQYSVVSRGYGLEMLLLFAFCALHRARREHPLALAVVLAALANTEFFGFIISGAAALSLLFEGIWYGSGWRCWVRDCRLLFAAAIYAAGLGLAIAVAFPDASYTPIQVRTLDVGRIAAGVGGAILWPAGHGGGLSSILPALSAWVWAYFVYLMRRPVLLCFAAAALIGIEASFTLVYGPAAWHAGNLLLVVVATMWLDAADSVPTYAVSPRWERAQLWLGRILAGGVIVLLAEHVLLGFLFLAHDIGHDYSSSRRLGELLRSDPALAGAVVIGEPDSWVISLPYYAANPIYLPREGVYRPWVQYKRGRRSTYDLGALLAAAQELRAQSERPVVIVMGFDMEKDDVQRVYDGTSFEETFMVTPEARAQFRAATRRIASLPVESYSGPWTRVSSMTSDMTTDEGYDVYVLR